MEGFKENTQSFIGVLKSGLATCEVGSSIDLRFEGVACAVKLELKANSIIAETVKKLLLLGITAWGKCVVIHFEDESKINVHLKVTYNKDKSFSVTNSMDADDILNTINFNDEA